ncbi:MAG: hypothetical protein COA47_03430 [Robiginitomaculum sp.]|nr:MAG: hypothetical protein COA47_03430 [Robiginitomaculum sp.]
MNANPALVLDVVALGVLLLSSVLALTRGFVRESLSIASFVVASLATIFTLPVFRQVTMNWIDSELIATGVTALTIFLGVYVVMTMLTHKVSGFVHMNRHIGVLDRTAGFAFGVVRGMVMLALVLLGWNFLTKPGQTPDWVSTARVYPVVSATAVALKSLVPNSIVSDIRVSENSPSAPPPQQTERAPAQSSEQGYEQSDRRTLDQVITTRLENDTPETEPDSGSGAEE